MNPLSLFKKRGTPNATVHAAGDRVLLYHAKCPDGFAAAYAAWKAWGDSGTYIAVEHGLPYPKDAVSGKHVVMADFSYKKEVLQEIASIAKSLVILDHHQTTRDDVLSVPGSVFDNDHSGAYLSWKYFHPDTQVPKLARYVEDGDLYAFKLPHAREILEYMYSQPFDFKLWDALAKKLESEDGFNEMLSVGSSYRAYYELQIRKIAAEAELVSFEGYEVYGVSASRTFASDVGNILAEQHPPIALIWKFEADKLKISLRSDGSVDVAKIAEKYGGGGHHNAASFNIPRGAALPFEKIRKGTPSALHI